MILPEASCFSCPHGLATLLTGGGLGGILFEVAPMSDNLDLTGNALFHLGIEYGFSEIFSAYFLMMIFSGGSVKSYRSKD